MWFSILGMTFHERKTSTGGNSTEDTGFNRSHTSKENLALVTNSDKLTIRIRNYLNIICMATIYEYIIGAQEVKNVRKSNPHSQQRILAKIRADM